MAHRNCFGNVSDNLHSSDYISRKKAKTIYKNAVNLANQGGISHKKTSLGKNKGTYVGNIYIGKHKCLIGAKDYDSLLSVTNGKYLVNPSTLDVRSAQDLWAGSIYAMDMSGVTSIVAYPDGSGNTFIYPPDIRVNQTYPINTPPDEQGLIVDPSYNIFYKADINQSARGVCYLKNERSYKQYLQCLPYTEDIAKTYLEVSNRYIGEYFYPKSFAFDCPDESWRLNILHCGGGGIVSSHSSSIQVISGTGTFLNSDWTGAGSPTSFKIDGFTSIGNTALVNEGTITNVVIGNSVTTIEATAFSGCIALSSVVIGNSVVIIENGVFTNCPLVSITIPDSTTSIGWNCFDSCTSLNSVSIGNSVATIGNGAFKSCTALSAITIPASVTDIGEEAFSLSTLTSVTFEAGSGLISIGLYAFLGVESLTSITIPASVTTIGDDAFKNCTALTTVTFEPGSEPSSMSSITFYDLNAITVFMNSGTLSYLNSHYTLSLSFASGQSFFGATDVTISEL